MRTSKRQKEKSVKSILFALITLLTFTAPVANAEEANYISDELFTYMHKGPSSEYRILGSVNAGTKVTVLEKNNSGFTKIRDDRGRIGWIQGKFISSEPSLKIKVPQLVAELAAVKAALEISKNETKEKNQELIDSLAQRTNQVKELEQYTGEQNQQLLEAQSEIRELRARIDTQKDDLLMRYFTYGALVLGGGLLLGLVLPMMIPQRKKKPSGWA